MEEEPEGQEEALKEAIAYYDSLVGDKYELFFKGTIRAACNRWKANITLNFQVETAKKHERGDFDQFLNYLSCRYVFLYLEAASKNDRSPDYTLLPTFECDGFTIQGNDIIIPLASFPVVEGVSTKGLDSDEIMDTHLEWRDSGMPFTVYTTCTLEDPTPEN